MRESIKNYLFQDAFAVYLFPSGIISKGAFNIGIMSYPKNSKIVEYNEKSKLFRLITKKDLAVLAGKKGKTVTTISQYYIRDTRLFELYIALRYICLLKINSLPMLTRENLDLELQKLNVPDNGNWRNAFISLSSLGFIDNDNLPTEKGLYLGIHNFCDFAYTIYIDYIKPYVDLIQYAIDESNANKNPTSLIELRNLIEKSHGNQKILFLTDSGTRYLSSWLNIMRDDYNCIKFISGKTNRTYMIEYRLSQFNEGTIKEKIKYNTFANNYIANSIQLFKETYLLKEIGDKK